MTFFSVIDEQERNWQDFVATHIGPDAQLVCRSASSTQRRVYKKSQVIFKIALSQGNDYENNAEEEYRLLQKLKHIPCVPKPISYSSYESISVLSIQEYHGDQIGQFGDLVSVRIASLGAVAKAIFSLNRHGLRHGDLQFTNFLFSSNDDVKILDYDQAIFTTPVKAFLGDFFGIGPFPAKRCALRFLIQIFISKLPKSFRTNLRIGALVRRWRFRNARSHVKSNQSCTQLYNIWNKAMMSEANAPKDRLSYHSLVYSGYIYQGERPWEVRWAPIRKSVNFKGKRLLELGCNLGLLSCYAQHEGALPGGIGVDYDPGIIHAAKKMALFAGVNVKFRVHNFDKDARWEDEFRADVFDIVSAFSVLEWVKEKKRFLSFIGRFPEVLYEGHDSMATELARLNSAGFFDISVIAVSERGRAVLLAKKNVW